LKIASLALAIHARIFWQDARQVLVNVVPLSAFFLFCSALFDFIFS
jgi:hypothetical protein